MFLGGSSVKGANKTQAIELRIWQRLGVALQEYGPRALRRLGQVSTQVQGFGFKY